MRRKPKRPEPPDVITFRAMARLVLSDTPQGRRDAVILSYRYACATAEQQLACANAVRADIRLAARSDDANTPAAS